MHVTSRRIWAFCLLASLAPLGGCAEVRGRRKVREANALYKEGRYWDAIRAYDEAAARVPRLPTLWLNKGIACRQVMIPGAKTAENEAAVACAIEAFEKLKELSPQDPRGEQLQVQTLFDADRFETLAAMYQDRVHKNPLDLEAVNGLVQVYSRWNRGDDALDWHRRKADLEPHDPESQYALGVFAWQQLSQRGGGPDKAAFDPRPDPDKPKQAKEAPLFGMNDIAGSRRIAMADLGIRYLDKAVSLRAKYPQALTYLNLLYRQKAFAYFSDPDQWQACIDQAAHWQKKALEAQASSPSPAGGHDSRSEDSPR